MAEETIPPASTGQTEAPNPKPAAADASAHPRVASLRAGVPGAVVAAKEFAGQVTVTVAREKIADVARHLKEKEDFAYCVDVTAVDWRERQPRLDRLVPLFSLSQKDA